MSSHSKTMLRKGTVKAHKPQGPRGYSPRKESVSGQEEAMLLDEAPVFPEKPVSANTDAAGGRSA